MRRGAKPGKAKVKAKPPIARRSWKSEGSRVHDLEKGLAEALAREAEALEQQTATADVLRIIAESPTELQPVLDVIAASALRLCEASDVVIERLDGDRFYNAAHAGAQMKGLVGLALPLTRQFPGGRAVLDRQRVILDDIHLVAETEYPDTLELLKLNTVHSCAEIPLLSKGKPLGSLAVLRAEVRPFTDAEVALLETFADQAVIAIENVRLFNETKEALERQTATSEILRVISTSPTEVQPVFDAIVRSAARLCDGLFSTLFQFDGELLHIIAGHNTTPEALEALHRVYPARPTRALVAARAIVERTVVHISDAERELESEQLAVARAVGWRSALIVPMLREGAPVGVITVGRTEAGPFSDGEIELLKTFADQAVIAIQNVRLFNELQGRNRDLTATSEILRVISSSPADVQPVFDAIADSAARLCQADLGGLFRVEDGQLHEVSSWSRLDPGLMERLRRVYPRPLDTSTFIGRAIVERRVVHVPDMADPAAPHSSVVGLHLLGFRSQLSVPMLHGGESIGGIAVVRRTSGLFSDDQVQLLQTFADQAVIAIQNVRLFKDLEARTGELTRSVEKLTALGEVSRALSSTLDVEAVLNTIVSRASELAGAAGCSIYEYDEAAEQFELRATHNYDPEFVAALRSVPLRKGEGLMGRAAEMREPVQIPDITQPGAYQSSARDTLIRFGYRALLSVPLLREEQIIGSLSFNRRAPGEFPPEVVEVLKTFATQSALAIQNARLFHEIADKSRQLEAASRHKSEFLANMSHELRTPLNAVIGFSEVLLQRMFGELNEKQDEYLKDIYASGQHLLSLINDILDLSKIEAGRMELTPAPFHLPTALESAVTLVKERAARHGITLELDIDPRLGELVGDERKVKQVLLNLLSNAVKFTPEGGRISLRAGRRDGAVAISVTDTGIGIASEDQAAIFEEFRQVGSDETRKQEGTGLGLTLAKKFVELHNGRMWVESELGRGSTFTFMLPVS